MEEKKNRSSSVDLAYQLAMRSYEVSEKSWERVNNIPFSIVQLSIPLVLAIPILKKALELRETQISLWIMVAGITFFLATVVLSFWARLSGTQLAINPSNIWEKHMNKPEDQYKSDLTYYAGKDFAKNFSEIRKKWAKIVWASIFCILQAVTLALWVFTASQNSPDSDPTSFFIGSQSESGGSWFPKGHPPLGFPDCQ